jgi:multiple sugar transport system permease protein
VNRVKFVSTFARYILLTLWAVFALFPLLWMLLISFKSDAQMYNTVFLFNPTLENYAAVLTSSDYIRCFIDNIIVSFGAVALSVLFGVPAAYALARYDFKRKEALAFQILSYRFAPEILVVLPIFLVFQKLHIYDSYFALIWVYQLIAMPLIIWVIRGYFEDISVEIEQAAQVDGYKWYQIFWKIMLPLVKPGLVAASLLAFIFAWNNFTFSLILTSFRVQTVTISALRYIATDTVHYGQMAVAATVAVLPEVIMALCIQKHLVRGLSFGAVKG